MRKLAYRFLCATLAVLLALDTAAAGRWLRSCGLFTQACPESPCVAASCCEPCVPCEVECDPCAESPAVLHELADAACGCGAEGVTTATMVESPTIATEHPVAEAPTPAAPVEAYETAPAPPFAEGFRSDAPQPAEAAEAPGDDWAPRAEESTATPATAEESEDLFAPPAAEEPVDSDVPAVAEEPVATGETVDVEDSAADAMEDSSDGEDLFSEEATEPMAEETPMEEEPAAADTATEGTADDLFSEEAIDDAPAEDSVMEDESTSGDLFDEESAPTETAEVTDQPADDFFGEESAETPAEDEPMQDDKSGEDLFGDSAAEEKPAEEAPTEDVASGDDLFGDDTAADAPATEGSADDLFGEDASGAAAPEEGSDADLFDGLGEEEATSDDETPTDTDAPAEDEAPAEDSEDDLFGTFGAVLQEPGGIDSGRNRTWVDDTGRFSTVGRLIAVDADAVRLAKHDGGVATVPLARLSQADLEFVSRQALAQHSAEDAAIARGERRDVNSPSQARAKTAPLLRTAQL